MTLLDRAVLCAGAAAFFAAQWMHKSAPRCSHRISLRLVRPHVCSPVSAGSTSRRGGWGHNTVPWRSSWRAWLEFPHHPRAQEMQTTMLTSSSGPELFPGLPESSCGSLQFLLLSLVFQKLFLWLSVISRRNCSKCTISTISTRLVCSWEGESSESTLDLPPHLIFNW